jgi:hypothetical protein
MAEAPVPDRPNIQSSPWSRRLAHPKLLLPSLCDFLSSLRLLRADRSAKVPERLLARKLGLAFAWRCRAQEHPAGTRPLHREF